MAEVCGTMQKDGKLPGIAAGENNALTFSSKEVDFFKKDDVRYPLQTDCLVSHEGKETACTFRKETTDGSWSFVN